MISSAIILAMSQLPLWKHERCSSDWLIDPAPAKAGVFRTEHPNEIVLANGLIARTIRLSPNAATVSIQNLKNREELLRGIRPEAHLSIDGKPYDVGGLQGQPDLAYLTPDWLDSMKSIHGSFEFVSYKVGKPEARLPWKRARPAPDIPWPPKGVSLTLTLSLPKGELDGVNVHVHYELYDGMPVLSKWITVENSGVEPLTIDKFTSELLRFVEPESVVDSNPSWMIPNVTIATDYSFGGMAVNNSNRTANWLPDPEYTTQVNYDLKMPCILEMRPPLGPAFTLEPGKTFSSFRTFELFHDSTDRERKGLGVRKMMRALSPWSAENPLMMHVTSTDENVMKTAIDQAAECGFEMIILSFGSGLNMEDVRPKNIFKFKAIRDYAKSKGLDLGGYSLLASRSIDKENDVVNPKPIFGASPCLGSKWGLNYFKVMKMFIADTGFSMLEHDGSYPGDPCASTVHPGHKGLEDSQWNQFQIISDFYQWCRERGVFLNVPDNYFLSGSNKTGMGYRETNWSLPRAQQHIHARQNLFDGTWEKTPSMGWMFVPLVEYQGGGAAATIEPLKDHLRDYEMHMMNNLGYGAQACYRGPRLYDSPETKAVVTKWVAWFKKYRDILESDVIHVRRADGKNLDCILHVNPGLPIKGLAMVYNPTDHELTQEIELPLYYTGLTNDCIVSVMDTKPKAAKLSRDDRITIKPTVPPRGCIWITFKER